MALTRFFYLFFINNKFVVFSFSEGDMESLLTGIPGINLLKNQVEWPSG